MLPLSLLSTATGQAMLIELKNGDTYNGKLVGADTWMNVNLEDVICTSRDGDPAGDTTRATELRNVSYAPRALASPRRVSRRRLALETTARDGNER